MRFSPPVGLCFLIGRWLSQDDASVVDFVSTEDEIPFVMCFSLSIRTTLTRSLLDSTDCIVVVAEFSSCCCGKPDLRETTACVSNDAVLYNKSRRVSSCKTSTMCRGCPTAVRHALKEVAGGSNDSDDMSDAIFGPRFTKPHPRRLPTICLAVKNMGE